MCYVIICTYIELSSCSYQIDVSFEQFTWCLKTFCLGITIAPHCDKLVKIAPLLIVFTYIFTYVYLHIC